MKLTNNKENNKEIRCKQCTWFIIDVIATSMGTEIKNFTNKTARFSKMNQEFSLKVLTFLFCVSMEILTLSRGVYIVVLRD